jgi:hypothetical protein
MPYGVKRLFMWDLFQNTLLRLRYIFGVIFHISIQSEHYFASGKFSYVT